MPKSEAKEVLERITTAYGLKHRVELCEIFGITANALSNRVSRKTFPADLVVQCALETGADLGWLTNGEGVIGIEAINGSDSKLLYVKKLAIYNGELVEEGTLKLDSAFTFGLDRNLNALFFNNNIYFLEVDVPLTDGKWLVDIEGKASIRDLTLIPVKRLHVAGGSSPFECGIADIATMGKVIGIYSEINKG